MGQMSLTLAAEICGAAAQDPLLEALCATEEAVWNHRLPRNMAAADCGSAFLCAVAFTAAADYLAAQAAGEPAAFTAGEVSVKSYTPAERAALAQELRLAAQRLMAPFVGAAHFCFKGVEG